MASFTPVITINTTPSLQVTMAGAVTYQEFLNSLGQFVYWLEVYQMQCNSINQLQEELEYFIYNVDGTIFRQTIVPNVDPFQYAVSLRNNVKDMGIILNGQSSIAFTILPNETIQLILCTKQVSNQDALNFINKNNFKRVDDIVGNLKLFVGYKSCL